MFGIFAFVAFWVAVIFAFSSLNKRTPLIFIALWIIGLIVAVNLNFSPYIFMSFQAFLAVVLFVLIKIEAAGL